ncbi:hypothetical protein [Bacillus sp. FJAT-42315]|nr:hypothetical protein [Bacillus sp. FJAT-42315]
MVWTEIKNSGEKRVGVVKLGKKSIAKIVEIKVDFDIYEIDWNGDS